MQKREWYDQAPHWTNESIMSRGSFIVLLVCLIAMVAVWWPSQTERNEFRDVIVHEPALGHWIYTEAELLSVHEELNKMLAQAEASEKNTAPYTAEQHFQNMQRITLIEKSLLPVEHRMVVMGRGPVDTYWASPDSQFRISNEASRLLTGLHIRTKWTTTQLSAAFHQQGREQIEKYGGLADDAEIFKTSLQPVVETDYHARPFASWIFWTYLQSIVVALGFFGIRVQIVGVSPWQILLKPEWLFFWPIGIWVYPTNDPYRAAKIVAQRLAWAMGLFLSAAVPNNAMAQNKKADEKKKRDDGHSLLLVPSNTTSFEGPPDQMGLYGQDQGPKGTFELFVAVTPSTGSSYVEAGAGSYIQRKKFKTLWTLYAGQSSDGYQKVAIGTQLYWALHDRFFLAVPYLRYGAARNKGGPLKGAFEFQANPFWTPGPKRLAIAPDVYISREAGTTSGFAGIGVEVYNHQLKNSIGAAVLRSFDGDWRLRFRYIMSFKLIGAVP
jgi:hypothetical protein